MPGLTPSFTLLRMHPAISGTNRTIGIITAVVGFLALLLSANPGFGTAERAFAQVLFLGGLFMLMLSLIYFAVHVVGELLYRQEELRRERPRAE